MSSLPLEEFRGRSILLQEMDNVLAANVNPGIQPGFLPVEATTGALNYRAVQYENLLIMDAACLNNKNLETLFFQKNGTFRQLLAEGVIVPALRQDFVRFYDWQIARDVVGACRNPAYAAGLRDLSTDNASWDIDHVARNYERSAKMWLRRTHRSYPAELRQAAKMVFKEAQGMAKRRQEEGKEAWLAYRDIYTLAESMLPTAQAREEVREFFRAPYRLNFFLSYGLNTGFLPQTASDFRALYRLPTALVGEETERGKTLAQVEILASLETQVQVPLSACRVLTPEEILQWRKSTEFKELNRLREIYLADRSGDRQVLHEAAKAFLKFFDGLAHVLRGAYPRLKGAARAEALKQIALIGGGAAEVLDLVSVVVDPLTAGRKLLEGASNFASNMLWKVDYDERASALLDQLDALRGL